VWDSVGVRLKGVILRHMVVAGAGSTLAVRTGSYMDAMVMEIAAFPERQLTEFSADFHGSCTSRCVLHGSRMQAFRFMH